jgi:hypothetical protein
MRAITFAIIIGFTSTACAGTGTKNAGTVPLELRGTWIGSGAEVTGKTYVFTADTYSFSSNKGLFTAGSLVFKKAVNRNPISKTEYPSGYKIHATQTSGTGSYSGFIGNEYDEDPIFLNADKTKFCFSSEDWAFTKK